MNRDRQARWDKNGLKTVSTKLPRAQAEEFEALCESEGTTKYAVLRNFVVLYAARLRMRKRKEVPPVDETRRSCGAAFSDF